MKQALKITPIPVRPPQIGLSVLAASLSLNLLALALPLVVLQVFDRVVPFQATETLFFLFLGLCVVVVLEFLLRWCRAVLLASQAERYETQLYTCFLNTTLNACPEAFKNSTPAAHLDRLGAISQLRSHFGGQGRALSIDLPFALIFVVMIGLIGGWLVLVPLTGLLLLFMFKTVLVKMQEPVFEKRKSLDGRRYSFLVELLTQIKTLKANTMEPQMQRRYELLQQQTADISRDIILFSGVSQTFGALFSQLAVAGMGLLGGYLVVTHQIGVAELAACMLLNGRTVQPMLKALNLWAQSESLGVAKEKVAEGCSFPQLEPPATGAELRGGMRFEDLSAKHPSRGGTLFHAITGEVKPGECLALLGEVPDANTAFFKMLLAEAEPDGGTLVLDDQSPEQFTHFRGRDGIVYCDQNPVVFSGTVIENISAFGDGEAIEIALRLAESMGLDRTLHRLPMGYNTPVHEAHALKNNRNFLQAMTLVRALALHPRILLLDNVTAALDSATAVRLASVLSDFKGQMTIILSDSDARLCEVADNTLTLGDPQGQTSRDWYDDAEADRMSLENDATGADGERVA